MAWVIGLVGAGVSAYGGSRSGRSEKLASEREAFKEKIRVESAEKKKLEEIQDTVGLQRSRYAASGVDVNVGSPLAVLRDTYDKGYQDLAYIRQGDTSSDITSYARARSSARSAQTASTLITAFGQSYDTYNRTRTR